MNGLKLTPFKKKKKKVFLADMYHLGPYPNPLQLVFETTYLPLLVSSQFKVLASFDGQLFSVFAGCTLHTQHNLLGCFCLDTNQYRVYFYINNRSSEPNKMCISIETKTENHCSTTSSFSNNRNQVELSNEVYLFAIWDCQIWWEFIFPKITFQTQLQNVQASIPSI